MIKKLFITFIIIFCFAQNGYSADDWYSASDGSGTDCTIGNPCTVEYAVETKASAGDTVHAIAGTYSFTSAVKMSASGLKLEGAGIDVTYFVDDFSSSPGGNEMMIIDIDVSEELDPPELSNFTLRPDSTNYNNAGIIFVRESPDGFLMHDIKVEETTVYSRAIGIHSPASGVIYDCEFDEPGSQAIRVYPYQLGGADSTLWTTETHYGGSDNVFIEDCTWNKTNYIMTTIDIEGGGRVVFRENTLNNAWVAQHGREGTAGTLRNEIYNNTFVITTATNAGSRNLIEWRGGTMLIHNNTITLTGSSLLSRFTTFHYCWFENRDSCGDITGCHSDLSFIDACSTYPCENQQGRTYDQILEPAFIFGNTYNGSSYNTLDYHTLCAGATLQAPIDENREFYEEQATFDGTVGVGVGLFASMPATCTAGVGYWATDRGSWNASGDDGVLYKCTSTDTWESYYTPYAYPHPLRGLAAALTGTITTATETDIVNGGETIIITLTGTTWVAEGATFNAQRQNIIDSLNSAFDVGATGTAWNAEVRDKEVVTAVVRTDNDTCTITTTAASYVIAAGETITVTVPSTATVGGVEIVASPTFSISNIDSVSGNKSSIIGAANGASVIPCTNCAAIISN